MAFKKFVITEEHIKLLQAIKFESFIFDAFEKLEDIAVLRVKREDEFAPVKGKEGVDSVETAIELYNKYHFGN